MSNIQSLALDLTQSYPRSPRELLAGFVIAGRTLDKCRAKINGSLGDYKFDCPLDNQFFDFSGITPSQFEDFVATGADDNAVEQWIADKTFRFTKTDIVLWNNKLRYTRPVDLPRVLQEFLEGYIPQFIPKNKIVYVWFDVYDIEEGRI